MAEPASIDIQIDENGALGVMFLRGEIDIISERDMVAKAAALLKVDTVRRLVLDLAKVTFIDSFGVRGLMKIYQMTQDAGRTATLRNPSRIAAAVLKIAAIDKLFNEQTPPTKGDDGESRPGGMGRLGCA